MGEVGGVAWGEDRVGGKNRGGWQKRKEKRQSGTHPSSGYNFGFMIFKPWLAVMGLIYPDSATVPGKPPCLKGLQRCTEGRREIRMGEDVRKFYHVKVKDEGKNEKEEHRKGCLEGGTVF